MKKEHYREATTDLSLATGYSDMKIFLVDCACGAVYEVPFSEDPTKQGEALDAAQEKHTEWRNQVDA